MTQVTFIELDIAPEHLERLQPLLPHAQRINDGCGKGLRMIVRSILPRGEKNDNTVAGVHFHWHNEYLAVSVCMFLKPDLSHAFNMRAVDYTLDRENGHVAFALTYQERLNDLDFERLEDSVRLIHEFEKTRKYPPIPKVDPKNIPIFANHPLLEGKILEEGTLTVSLDQINPQIVGVNWSFMPTSAMMLNYGITGVGGLMADVDDLRLFLEANSIRLSEDRWNILKVMNVGESHTFELATPKGATEAQEARPKNAHLH